MLIKRVSNEQMEQITMYGVQQSTVQQSTDGDLRLQDCKLKSTQIFSRNINTASL